MLSRKADIHLPEERILKKSKTVSRGLSFYVDSSGAGQLMALTNQIAKVLALHALLTYAAVIDGRYRGG